MAKKKQTSYIVAAPFQDAREYATTAVPNQYAVGDDVSHMEPARLATLVERGLVTAPETTEEAE